MEVTLKTEVEAGASGFSVTGGGNEGIFIKKVLKESPASKIFSMREGDQLLSATIFFDNIKYEDALKILQYSEPYRVQFSLKRKIAGKELEHIHSTAQYKKEKLSQDKELSESIPEETLHISGKTISEEDKETLIVNQRVGRSKRPKKDRLSWPKFQSIKNKKILGHRRSHSTSDAYEPATQDISPTSTDTESQFQQEINTKEKKGSQKKLKFPNIGFKMHRSKPEPKEKQTTEIKTTLLTEIDNIHKEDIIMENPEILTVEYTTSSAYEMKTGEVHETLTKDLKEMKNGIPTQTKKRPEVEISIKKQEDQESTLKFTVPEVPAISTQISKPSLETPDLKESPAKQTPQATSKSRKKKLKGITHKIEGESGINIEIMDHPAQESIEIKGLEIGTAKAELHTTADALETREKQAEDNTQILTIQKTKFRTSMPKREEPETESTLTKSGSDVPFSVPETTDDTSKEGGRKLDVKTDVPDAESEASTWKIKMPSFKMAKIPKDDIKLPREERIVQSVDTVKKAQAEEDDELTTDEHWKTDIDMKAKEKDTEGKESKFRLPKFKLPTFSWATLKDETGEIEGQVSHGETKVHYIEASERTDISITIGEMQAPSVETEKRITEENMSDKNVRQLPEVQMPSLKMIQIKTISTENQWAIEEEKAKPPKPDTEKREGELSVPSKEREDISETISSKEEETGIKFQKKKIKMPKMAFFKHEVKVQKEEPDITKYKLDITLPSTEMKQKEIQLKASAGDVSLSAPDVQLPSLEGSLSLQGPEVDLKAPSAEGALDGAEVEAAGLKGKIKMPKFDKPKFGVSPPKAQGPEAEVSLPTAEVGLPAATVSAAGLEGPALGLKADVPGAKTEGAGWKVEMPSLKMPKADIKAPKVDIGLPSVDITLPKASVDLQAPEAALTLEGEAKAPEKEASKAKDSKFKMPKFGMPSLGWSSSREAKGSVAADVDVSLKEPQVTVPSGTAEAEVTLPGAEIQAPGAELTIEAAAGGDAEKGRFKMPDVKMPSVKLPKVKAPHVQVSLPKAEVSLPKAQAEIPEVTLPGAEIQAPGAELTIEAAAGGDAEKGRFKMPDVKMPSVKLPKVKAPHVQVSLPKAEVSLPKAQAEIPEAELTLQGPEAEGSLDAAPGKVEGSGMKLHMPKVKVPGVAFSKPTVKAPKVDADVSLPKVDVSLPEAELKAGAGDVSLSAPDVQLPSLEGSLSLQGPEVDLKAPSAEGALDGAEVEAAGLKGKIKMPKFDKPKFGVSPPKAQGPEAEVSLPTAEVGLPAATVSAAGLEGPALGLKADVPGAKTEGAGWKVEMPSLKMPKADIKAPKVDIGLPSVDITLPKASVDLQAPEAALTLEGEAKAPEKEASKAKDSKFKMPKFGMPSFGWSSSREAKGAVAADVDVSLKEPQVTVPSGTAEAEVTLPGAEIQAPDYGVPMASFSGKDVEMGKTRSSLFKIPKVSLSKTSKSEMQSRSSSDFARSECFSYIVAEEAPVIPSSSVGPKPSPDDKGETASKNTKFKIPSLSFSKVDISSSKIEQLSELPKGDVTLTKYQMNLPESECKISPLTDMNLSATDFEILPEEGSLEPSVLKSGGETPLAEISVDDTEYTVKIPRFRKPKFGISWSKGRPPESDIHSKVESEISKEKKTSDMSDIGNETPTQVPDTELCVKMQKPSPEVVLDAPKLDIILPSMEVTMPKVEMEIRHSNLECKAEQEVISGEKDTEEKEIKFKMSKFKLPSFRWSPKKEAVVPSEVEAHLEEPIPPALSGDTESEFRLTIPENQYPSMELDTSTEKDGEKGKMKKSPYGMPKISLSKVKGQKVHVSLPKLETDVCEPKQGKEGGVSVKRSEKGSSGDEAGMGIKTPKVKISTLEFSKPEVKVPKVDMDVSMSTGKVIPPTCEVSLQQVDLTLKSAAADASLSSSDVKMKTTEGSLELKSPETTVERTSSEITVGTVEIKHEGPEEKGKKSKLQMPKFGITHLKGKVPEKEVIRSKSEIGVPQLKAMIEIADIGVEAPNLEVESAAESPKAQMPEADNRVSKIDVHLPSGDISVPKTDSDIQDSDTVPKVKEEIKHGDVDGEEKEGHFKMSKFKLPSFSWSPKKEACVKPDSGAHLEDHKITIVSGRIGTEETGTATDDQGPSTALDLEISAGKGEQKSQIKKPQFVMPKISLSKIRVPKSQVNLPKVEADATIPKIEEDGDDSVRILDIERCYSKSTDEGAQISIKMAEVKIPTLEFSRTEIGASQTDMGVSSGKADLPASEASLQQVVLKSSSADEDTSQKRGIKLPKGEASIELKSPETGTEGSSVVDGRKMKLEGLEGKIKMPKFQKPKFGISLIKGKGPEPEISSPKTEAELPQLQMTTEIADVVGVPASEFKSDTLDPGAEVYAGKIITPQVPTASTEVPKVDISLQSVTTSVTEGAIESPEEKDIKLKEGEIKVQEIQTEENQGWFKMPKFRIPAFGRTSLKEKKDDADVERSLERPQVGIAFEKIQAEINIPENTLSLPYAVTEITIGKEDILKLGDSVKSSDVSLPKMEGDISLSAERTDSKVDIPKTETYADVVKHSAEGQKMHTLEFKVSSTELSKTEISASKIDKDSPNKFPTCDLTLQKHKVNLQDIEIPKMESSIELETSRVEFKPSSAEITLDATQEKIDVSLPKAELDIQGQDAAIKTGKIKDETKIIGKDGQGSQLKMPVCEWSTTKGSEDDAYVAAKLEELKTEVPGVKMDVKIGRVDPEIEFQVESVEKDMSAGAEVQVEGREETSKIKTYKFKIPKFGVLHSKVKGSEDDINLPESEAVSMPETEIGTAEILFQQSEGSYGQKSPTHDRIEPSARMTMDTMDKSEEDLEVNIKIPKLKIPKFTFKAFPTEADVSVSKLATDRKGTSTDIEVVQLEASSATPATPEALEGGIQKAKSKILLLSEPDIKTAQITTTIDSSGNTGQDIHWSYVEGHEIHEKVEPEHVAIERCEIYTTEIVKESEILSSEVKTATLGFSLLKVKLPESHSNLDVLVQQSSTEYKTGASVSKPKYSGESFGVSAETTGTEELELSDKPHIETEASSGVVSSGVSLPKLKTFAVEVKPSSKLEDSHHDKPSEGITVASLSKDGDVAEALEDEEKGITDQKEKTDSRRSPGRFKFWLPSIGFSSSGDETSSDLKTEVKKSVPEDMKPTDTLDDDSSKQTEKTGWFRFPKLGFTSPSKKARTGDKEEETGQKDRSSDEDSPSDKPDVFFDAQESLSPKETITESEKTEIDGTSSNVLVSRDIVTSSARTELILLEEEKGSQSNIPGDTTK
nr:PREDICTED: protein AHNAK2 [Struthio camelus australis]